MYVFPVEMRKAYESIPIPIVIDQFIDGKVVPLLVSDGFCKLVEMERQKALAWFAGSQFERLHPDDVGSVVKVSDDFAHHRSGYNVFFRSRHADGYHSIHAVGEWMTMEDGTELAVLTYTDITETGKIFIANSEEYNLFRKDVFYTDPVTGLPNMNYFVSFGNEKVNALRVDEIMPSLVYIDVNSMKSYNNQYGFEKGDELLRLITAILTELFPGSLLIRGVEDHFIILTAEENLTDKLNTANDRIRDEAFGNTTGIHAGICCLEDEINLAKAMDRARQAIRMIGTDLNTVFRYYTDETGEWYWNQRYIVENFEKALHNGWFKVYYQGIADAETGKGVAMEALSRWVDPVRGIISPGEFIPVLSKYHLLHKMDLYIFEQVCREVEVRHDAGLPLVPVSVNFARQDFDHVNVVSEINRIVDSYHPERYGIGKDFFIIEITEQDMATATDQFYDQLCQIRKSGFRLWLDDFGSGYSSINVFSKFEVDMIKFDMELLRNLDNHNGVNREIMRAMVSVCKKMGIHTLAEGVENEEQKNFLRDIGCELCQGYLFHRPDPLESILYKLQCGQKVRALVTDDERKRLI